MATLAALPEDALGVVGAALPWTALVSFARASRACRAAVAPRLRALCALRMRPFRLADPHAASWDLARRGVGTAQAFVDLLPERVAHVTALDLAHNRIRHFHGAGLAAAFPALTSLDLRCNLLRALAHVPATVRTLRLAGNKLRCVGARLWLPRVCVLDLSDNEVGNAGALAVACLARRCAGLRELRVALNWIGDPGALALVGAAKAHPALVLLDLRDNPFGHQTVDAALGATSPHVAGCYVALL